MVARLDNEVTLKRYRRIDLATEELHIDGYVVGTLMHGMFEWAGAAESPA